MIKLDHAQQFTPQGRLLASALRTLSVIKLGVQVGLDEIGADEMSAMLIIEEERNRLENERSQNPNG